MLIASPRHTAADLDCWRYYERCDALECQTRAYRRGIDTAVDEIVRFAGTGPCYAGVSWGKDSVVMAHFVAHVAPEVPLVWIRPDERENPDCPLVRDAFLAQHPGVYYDEIVVPRPQADAGHGFAPAAARYGDRYISGVRADESGPRKVGLKTRGLSTSRTCAPLGWWSGAQIFAFLFVEGLPVHPAYACTQGGMWDRDRIRVSSIGGERGTEFGRREWERRYYPECFTHQEEK